MLLKRISKPISKLPNSPSSFVNRFQTRNFVTVPKIKRVTLLPGDGIGPEMTESVVGIFQAVDAPIEWERFDDIFEPFTHRENPQIFQDVIASIARNRVALKGPLLTAAGVVSQNLKLRKALDIYANVVPCASVKGIKTRHSDTKIDLVVVRENTQGEYSGFEHEIEPGVVQSLKIITESASRRIAEYAFGYAVKENRKKVTAIHKANIQKRTDGLFLSVCRDVAKKYPQIQYSEMIIDNCCMQLVMNPSQFDVMLTPNLYGTIVTNVAAGLVGGPGIAPGANIGDGIAMFENGARHVARDIAGLNRVNPTGFILSGAMMLKHLGYSGHANKIEKAISGVIEEGKVLTPDLGGTATTKHYTAAVIDKILKL